MKLAAGRARDHADMVARATVLKVNPEEAVRLTLDAYGPESLEVITSLVDVSFDAHALIAEPRRD